MTIVHGQVCYLQVPTTDLGASARFYAAVLGWQTDPGEANGGRVLDAPSPDGPTRVLTTVADPSGNPVGLVSHAGGVQE